MSWPSDLELITGDLVPVCPIWTRNIQVFIEYNQRIARVQSEIEVLRTAVATCHHFAVLNQALQRKLNSRVVEVDLLTTRRALVMSVLSLDVDSTDAQQLQDFATD
jgi:hypothetical protein